MSDEQFQMMSVTAVEARNRVADLEAERALAEHTGVADIAAYLEDLDDELDFWRHRFTMAAVTEIAALHADLFGPNQG
ncbi:MAG TPA: hypothetical protein VHF58_00125 [Solirubrobacterales bacterium]|nr:hypothetical protein [Solirubrobacterales bacterium]